MGAKVGGGGGGGRYELGQNSDINVTPFVDVMLVLLIIFMVAAPLATVSIKVDLPPAVDRPDDVKPKDPVYISILQDGRLNLSGKQDTDMARLVGDLTSQLQVFDATKPPKDQSVLIRADKEVLYSDFMEVVNTLQQNGFYKVGLISEEV